MRSASAGPMRDTEERKRSAPAAGPAAAPSTSRAAATASAWRALTGRTARCTALSGST